MLAPVKSGMKTIGIWSIICILAILICPLMSLIQTQEAYAKGKKISGTSEFVTTLVQTTIPGKIPVMVITSVDKLKSTDPDWNNASIYTVAIQVDPPSLPSPASRVGDDLRFYSVITHPDGDQAFIESQGSWKEDTSVPGYRWSFERNGAFITGTGKFEGIKALWRFKGRGAYTTHKTGEWEVQYYGR